MLCGLECGLEIIQLCCVLDPQRLLAQVLPLAVRMVESSCVLLNYEHLLCEQIKKRYVVVSSSLYLCLVGGVLMVCGSNCSHFVPAFLERRSPV